jgi:hypothetical protein
MIVIGNKLKLHSTFKIVLLVEMLILLQLLCFATTKVLENSGFSCFHFIDLE